jgi:hypothetical protein
VGGILSGILCGYTEGVYDIPILVGIPRC